MTDRAHDQMAKLRTLAARRAAREMGVPLDARIGGPIGGQGGILTSHAEVEGYAGRENTAFESLENDVYRTLVFDDPVVLRLAAKKFRDLADTSALPGVPADIAKGQLLLADDLDASADRLQTKIDARGPEESKKEQAFSGRYRDFMARWRAYKTDNIDHPNFLDIGTASPQDAWAAINGFDAEFRSFYAEYKNLGYNPSAPLPLTPEQIDKLHDTPINIPWTKIIIGAAIVGGAYYLLTHKRTEATTVAIVPAMSPAVGAAP